MSGPAWMFGFGGTVFAAVPSRDDGRAAWSALGLLAIDLRPFQVEYPKGILSLAVGLRVGDSKVGRGLEGDPRLGPRFWGRSEIRLGGRETTVHLVSMLLGGDFNDDTGKRAVPRF